MITFKSKYIGISMVVFLMLPSIALSEGPGERQRGQGGDIVLILSSEEIKLEKGQREGLEKIKTDFEHEQASARAELKKNRNDLEALLKTYEVDIKRVEEIVHEMSVINERLLLRATMSRVEVRKVLSREQFDKVKELIEKRRGE